jgi:TonB family protein
MSARFRIALMILGLFLIGTAGAFAAQDEPHRVGGEVSRPEKISGESPVYPEAARRAGLSGVVIVEAIIDEKGNITNARVLKGLPLGLDEAALEAIQTWKFKPAKLNRRPVKVYYALTVNFQVEGTPSGGPVLEDFLKRAPTFADQLRSGDYKAASESLDRWAVERPNDPEVHLAWSYLFLRQGRLSESFREAQAYRGPEPYHILYRLGGSAWKYAANSATLTPEDRAKAVELGLQAVNAALADREDGAEALAYKSLLLQEKARLTQDPAEREALSAEAKRLQERSNELPQEN